MNKMNQTVGDNDLLSSLYHRPLPRKLARHMTASALLKAGFRKEGKTHFVKTFDDVLLLSIKILNETEVSYLWILSETAFQKMIDGLDVIRKYGSEVGSRNGA